MTRFDRTAALVTASLALAACDIDFVAVDTTRIVAQANSEHADAFTADFRLEAARDAALTVVLEGRSVPGAERTGGGTSYQARIAPDSLHPSIRLVVERGSGSGFDGYIPLLARRGPAEWLETALRLPLARGPSAEEPTHSLWGLVLRDSAGTELLQVGSRTTPLPTPLLLDREMVPETAVEAEVITFAGFSLGDGSSAIRVGTRSRVSFTIP